MTSQEYAASLHQTFDVTPAELSSSQVQITHAPRSLISQNSSIEARVSCHCHICCDVRVVETTLDKSPVRAVTHDEAFHVFEGEQPEGDIVAWIQALHFMATKPSTTLLRSRLYVQAKAPVGYDIAHAYDKGLISLDEARRRFYQGDTSDIAFPVLMFCQLDHNLVMLEVVQHLRYNIVNDKGDTLASAYISACHWLADISTCLLSFSKC